ncbi:hypothetical protein M433DRAFT_9589 [Acidomyces richmondensis BFW]|nr:hypothetical protein M433DRAFT_9589 [Acidomyces richmondensis BFW]
MAEGCVWHRECAGSSADRRKITCSMKLDGLEIHGSLHRGGRFPADYVISRQYLSPAEEKVLIKYILRLDSFGNPVSPDS